MERELHAGLPCVDGKDFDILRTEVSLFNDRGIAQKFCSSNERRNANKFVFTHGSFVKVYKI